jgi:DNA-binding NarL/FixJ family response regulator/signal transduction histidine kinase
VIRRPVAASPASADVPATAILPEVVMHRPLAKILLVEDDPTDVRQIMAALMGSPGLETSVATADSLAAARHHLATDPADLVILDLALPDSNGLDTLRAVVAETDAAVVVLTATDDEATALDCLREGADDFLRREEIAGGALVRAVRYALERRRRAGHEHFLSHALAVIGGTVDGGAALRRLADLVVPALADWCLVELLEPDGEVTIAELVAARPETNVLLRSKLSSYPHHPAGRHPAARALTTGEAVLMEELSPDDLRDIAADDTHLQLLEALGTRSMVAVPIPGDGAPLGAVTLATAESGRRLSDLDRSIASELAAHAAMVVLSSRRVAAAEQGRSRAEATTERVREIDRVSNAIAAAVTTSQVAAACLREAVRLSGAAAGALLVAREAEDRLSVLRTTGLPDPALPLFAEWRLLGDGPVGEAVRSGGIVHFADPDAMRSRDSRLADLLQAHTLGGLVILPIFGDGTPLGALVLVAAGGRTISPGVDDILLSCAARCAPALDRAFALEREQRALADARHATRLRDEVLGIVAHDLRNPVTAIATYAALLKADHVSAENRVAWAGTIEEVVRSMNKLIQDLIDVCKIESGALGLDLDAAQPDDLIGDALSLMEPVAAASGVQLRCEIGGPLPPILGDRDRILQVFSNLIHNAVKHTPRGAVVTIRGEALGSEVLFLVVDSGPGIPLEDRPRLFDRFWQARQSRRGGAGLGLAIAKGIVDRHGGRIGVESSPRAGSTFFFTLPRAGSEEDRAHSAQQPSLEPAEVGDSSPTDLEADIAPAVGGRVLIVDDHPLVRRGIRETLQSAGRFEVAAEAGSGEEAVRLCALARPDVVLMDINLPGMDGIEATRRITAEQPGIHVLGLSAEPEDDVLLDILDAGGSGFVRKDCVAQDLHPALETAMRGEVFLYPSGNKLLLGEFRFIRHDALSGPASTLTEQERQVLALAAEGYNSSEIGKKLFLSPKTIDSYRSRAMRRVGLSSRPDLVRFAVRAGLLVDRTPAHR